MSPVQSTKSSLRYLVNYPLEVQAKVLELLGKGELKAWIAQRYPGPPAIQNDRALYEYVSELKSSHLRTAPPVSKVYFDDRLEALARSLGQRVMVSRVQGKRLKAKHEIRIASLFKQTPPEFLRMVVVHELAHLREFQHNNAFYQLCCHIEPNYHEYEFGLRVYLTLRDAETSSAPSSDGV